MKKTFKILKSIFAIIIGHLVVLKHLFKKAVTLEYPEKKCVLNDDFRGEHALVNDENGKLKCIACGTCQRVCPSFGTINIEREKNDEGKFQPKEFTIDLNKCMFCGNCVKYCPQNAIVMTKNYELAKDEKKALKLDINTLKNNYNRTIMKKRSIE
jgi:NADH-quinone oxidoreductase subunit I